MRYLVKHWIGRFEPGSEVSAEDLGSAPVDVQRLLDSGAMVPSSDDSEDLPANVTEARRRLVDANATIKAQAAEIASLRVSNSSAELDELRKQVSGFDAEREESAAQLSTAVAERDEAKAALDKATAELDELRKQISAPTKPATTPAQ